MKKIGVFCSASTNIESRYYDIAQQLGKWMGENNCTLVYGGSKLGLMGAISQAVYQNKGSLIGVIPTLLQKTNQESELPQERIYTQNLSDRKDILLEQSTVLIALPGGIGTLDEIFHVMGQATLGYHNKKIIIYNINGFYNQLLDFLAELKEKEFIRQPLSTYYIAVDNFDDLILLLK